jgi:hypothetical protein
MAARAITLLPSAARTTSGNGDGSSAAAEFREGNVLLDITAVSGTSPSLTATIETSADGSNWFAHTAFSAKTAAGKDVLKLANLGSYVRVSYTISGTSPSFTFSVVLDGKRVA